MAVISGTFGMALFSLAGFCTKERVVQTIKEPSILDGFKALIKNKPLLLIVIGNVLAAVSGIGGFFQAYYYSEVVQMNSLTIIITLPGTILGFVTYLLILIRKAKKSQAQNTEIVSEENADEKPKSMIMLFSRKSFLPIYIHLQYTTKKNQCQEIYYFIVENCLLGSISCSR